MNKANSGAILVIGAGVGGIKASFDLAEAGFKVYLCDRSPNIGGSIVQMDKWFPDNHCGMCQMLPTLSGDSSSRYCIRSGLVHPNIELLPLTEVKKVSGEVGNFQITLNFSLYPTGAIKLTENEKIRQLNVGAIILSAGFEEFDPLLATQYGYKRYPNVITSLEMERILSPSGPTAGKLMRPSDGRFPASIAFLQCVGSRDVQRDYCSSACCMYALKEATLIKQVNPEIDVHIFYMDMRAFGKGYYRYFEQARDKLGIKLNRCRVPVIKEDPQTRDLILNVMAENGTVDKRLFEMVALSVGQTPAPRFRELCETLGVGLNKWGFCRTTPFSPVETTRKGIYVCGSASAPKDIAGTITEAGAAACQVSELLSPLPVNSIQSQQSGVRYDEEPRMGILLCGCDKEISSIIDLKQAAESLKKIPDLAYVEEVSHLCNQDTCEKISEKIRNYNLNRVVIGACTPYINGPMFREFVKEAGLNPSLITTINLRENIAWVHRDNPASATEKAISLLAMAIELVRSQEPLTPALQTVNPAALVIGGGLAGMTAALSIARHGLEVHLLEKSNELGGNLKHIYSTLESDDTQALLKDIYTQVKANNLIHVHLETELATARGYAGNFAVTIRDRDKLYPLEAGAIIVASGGDEYRPTEYLYGQSNKIITQRELEEKMSSDKLDPRSLHSVVMIQCVGSREKERPYCSRFCCSQALKNALALKKENPEIEVFILYRDLMSYGFREEYYTRAREKGMSFIRYEPDAKPSVSQKGDRLFVELAEPVLGGRLILEPDLLILSTAVIPYDNAPLARSLGVGLNEDGFFQEAEVKFRPVDFLKEGIFVCGLAHSPLDISETITQAKAAAQRAISLLTRGHITAARAVSEIVQRRCAKCELCVRACSFSAREKDEETDEIVVREALCQGCGACVVACPSGATRLRGFKDSQVFSLIDAAF